MTSFAEALRKIEGTNHAHVLCVLDRVSGHKEFPWEDGDEGGCAVAEREFRAARENGLAAYQFDEPEQNAGEVIKEFNSEAKTIVMASPITGG